MKKRSMKKGFTLIELIAVIVILGILSAVAVPRFFDATEEAESATMQGLASAALSHLSLEYSRQLLDPDTTPSASTLAATCSGDDATLQVNSDKYTVTCAASGTTAVTVTVGGGDGDDKVVTWTMP